MRVLHFSKTKVYPFQVIHSAASSNELLDRHTTLTQITDVGWGARFSGHWVVTSMFVYVTPRRTSHRQLRKNSNGRSLSYRHHSNFKPTWIFWRFVCPLQMILLTKIKKIPMLVLGLHSKDRKSTKDKANISNPKVNRGCPLLTVSHTSADCVEISLGPSIQYIPLRVYRTGGFNAM